VIAYHEGLPGHHMQISIAQELTGVPKFQTQQFYGAYTEGWGLYSERFAKEIPGTYQDPYSDFGRLSSELWRAIRLVVVVTSSMAQPGENFSSIQRWNQATTARRFPALGISR